MKILFTRHTNYTDARWTDMDHVSDLIMHGLVMLGHEVTDAPKLWTVYKDIDEVSLKNLHGRGFTITRNIPNETHIDRENIEDKIRQNYFDLVILARVDFSSPYEDLIWENYKPEQIIAIDGKDQSNYHHNRDTRFMFGRCSYFKRELWIPAKGVFPINTSFPKEKIIEPMEKTQLWSSAKPIVSGLSYTFDNEKDYYQEYGRSYFGNSYKKFDWWDYQRHLEVIASGAIPVIPELRGCPENSLFCLPKDDLLATNQLINDHGAEWFMQGEGLEIYKILQKRIFEHFLEHGTSEAMAQYMLDTHKGHFA